MRGERLCRLAFFWKRKVGDLPSIRPLPETWGPSDPDVLAAGHYEYTEQYIDGDNNNDYARDDHELDALLEDDEEEEEEERVQDEVAEVFEAAELMFGQEMMAEEDDWDLYGARMRGLPSRSTPSTPSSSNTPTSSRISNVSPAHPITPFRIPRTFSPSTSPPKTPSTSASSPFGSSTPTRKRPMYSPIRFL